MPATHTTSLRREWLVKMVLFFLLLVFFGFYGLYDALYSYPARGREAADYRKWVYLKEARDARALDASASISDPGAEMAKLRTREDNKMITPLETARLEWLRALRVMRVFSEVPASETTIPDPVAELTRLDTKWNASAGGTTPASPKPLAVYDIPVQWVFVVVGFGGALWMLIHFVRVRARQYAWDETAKVLYLPDGASLAPADIEDFDKRKWDKYLIFLKVKPGHQSLGGEEVRLDLYQYAALEPWVLEMEKIAFPDREQGSKPAPSTPKEAAGPATS